MRPNEIPSLPDQRRTIHDLTIQKHSTGLSPPEEAILENIEANTIEIPGASDLLREFFSKVYECYISGGSL